MASRPKNYGLDDRNSNFAHFNDNDGMTREFLNTSSATFLASDRLVPGPEQQAAKEAELRHQEVLRTMRQIESRTLQSTKSSKIMLNESEKVGLETAEELVKQREQLQNTERKLDNITGDLKDTQKNINGIKSVFSSLKTWWSTPKQGAQGGNPQKESSTKAASPTDPCDTERVLKNHNLGSAYQKSQTSLATTQQSSTHPALQLRGFDDEEEDTNIQDWRESSRRVNAQLDADLGDMASIPQTLKLTKAAQKQQRSGGENPAAVGTYFGMAEMDQPARYNSKLMNSIWGRYNEHSVHNFKSLQCGVMGAAGAQNAQEVGQTLLQPPSPSLSSSSAMQRRLRELGEAVSTNFMDNLNQY